MNIKTLTVLVGSLSLGSLAAGCATTKTMAPEPGVPAAEEAHEGSHDEAPGTGNVPHGASPVPTEQQGGKHEAPQAGTQAAPAMNVTPAKAPAGQPAQATPAVEKTTEHKCGSGGCGSSGCGAPKK